MTTSVAPASPPTGGFEENPVHRAHTALRCGLLLVSARGLLAPDANVMPLVLCLVAMLLWTVFTAVRYSRQRPHWMLMVDLVVTFALILVSPLVVDPPGLLPDAWIAGAPLAVALWRSWPSGTVCAAVLALTAIIVVGPSTEGLAGGTTMIFACACVGYLVGKLRENTAELRALTAQRVAIAERQRLARIVHDGVLQVLALTEREGRSLGPRGEWLSRAAQEQEAALRALLQEQAAEPDDELVDCTRLNLAAMLDRRAGPTVTISTPAEKLMVEAQRAGEIDAAVGEALTNVAKHAGVDAQAWVLVELEGPEIVIGIRDNGRGGDPEDFVRSAEGRLGMKHSIRGRLAALGGQATLRTAPGQGVEWEFRVPRGEE